MSTTASTIFFGDKGFEALDQFLENKQPSKTFVLVDENTAALVPHFAQRLSHLDGEFEILEIPAGEQSKELEIAAQLWATLLDYGADRNALLINLGGGVVGDLGGFVASTYKRGISFVQVPTSLLAMVDASVGGKTGINFGGLKNQIGTFHEADFVLVEPEFLKTLPKEEWESGHGEMIKHCLLTGSDWPFILQLTPEFDITDEIQRSIRIKSKVVDADFKESGLRKTLNLGHTFGHAWESLMQQKGTPVSHGRAVVQGLHLALVLSEQVHLQREVARSYPWVAVDPQDLAQLWTFQLADKKNESGEVQFVLLSSLGNATHGTPVSIETWSACILWLNERGNEK